MAVKIIIKEADIKNVVEINSKIIEFDKKYSSSYFESRYNGKNRLILIGYFENKPAGYIVAYDKYNDGSFYCWMAGVDPKYRRKGIMSGLMEYLEKWAKENGYQKIKIKTRNNRRAMLTYLIRHGFYFISIEERTLVEDYRIILEHKII